MTNKNSLTSKLLIGAMAVLSLIGCSTLKPKSVDYLLNQKETSITYNILEKNEKEFKILEKKFYSALESGNTDTSEFYRLEEAYHSMKSKREQYENLLRINSGE